MSINDVVGHRASQEIDDPLTAMDILHDDEEPRDRLAVANLGGIFLVAIITPK